jgi:shikimate dehydrogenase
VPTDPPLIAAARARGCQTSTGTNMYHAAQTMMVEFLLGAD